MAISELARRLPCGVRYARKLVTELEGMGFIKRLNKDTNTTENAKWIVKIGGKKKGKFGKYWAEADSTFGNSGAEADSTFGNSGAEANPLFGNSRTDIQTFRSSDTSKKIDKDLDTHTRQSKIACGGLGDSPPRSWSAVDSPLGEDGLQDAGTNGKSKARARLGEKRINLVSDITQDDMLLLDRR